MPFGRPTSGRKCYITPAFSGVPKERGTKSELAGPTSGRKCYITPAFSGVPNKGDKIKGGPQVGGNATSPLHSRGSPTKETKSKGAHKWAEMLHHPCILGNPQRKGDKIRIGCLTRAFWEAHKWAEMLHHPCILGHPQRKGDKIRIGCLTPAFWEAHKWAEMLHHPCILGDPQQRGQSQSKKKAKKNKNKNCPMVSVILPTALQITPTGV